MKILSRIPLAALAAIVLTLTASSASASSEKVLFNFQGAAYGSHPQQMVRDSTGNIYAVTLIGGNATCTSTCGLVMKLSPNSSGQMTESILHTFSGGTDGDQPITIVMDSNGNLFVGADAGGGTGCDKKGCGTIVELSPIPTGGWKTTVVYTFLGGNNGSHGRVNLIDAAGNIYGFENGGSYNQIYELSPSSSGTWTHKIIYNGTSTLPASFPSFMDASGNIYGVVGSAGGTACLGGCGIAFELSPNSNGTWSNNILYSFQGPPNDGGIPWAIVPDGAGNIFGVTSYGGSGTNSNCKILNGCGTLFELSPSSSGGYTESVLHDFNYALDGIDPVSIVRDSSGNLYVAVFGGGVGGNGQVLEFSPQVDGPWLYTVLHAFADSLGGALPGNLQLDSEDNVYGIGYLGGSKGQGVVFELAPEN
jgi:hypothetical protein